MVFHRCLYPFFPSFTLSFTHLFIHSLTHFFISCQGKRLPRHIGTGNLYTPTFPDKKWRKYFTLPILTCRSWVRDPDLAMALITIIGRPRLLTAFCDTFVAHMFDRKCNWGTEVAENLSFVLSLYQSHSLQINILLYRFAHHLLFVTSVALCNPCVHILLHVSHF